MLLIEASINDFVEYVNLWNHEFSLTMAFRGQYGKHAAWTVGNVLITGIEIAPNRILCEFDNFDLQGNGPRAREVTNRLRNLLSTSFSIDDRAYSSYSIMTRQADRTLRGFPAIFADTSLDAETEADFKANVREKNPSISEIELAKVWQKFSQMVEEQKNKREDQERRRNMTAEDAAKEWLRKVTQKSNVKTHLIMQKIPSQKQFRSIICEHFNLEELETLTFDLSLNWDELEGPTLSKKCQSLIGVMRRNGRLPELLELLQQERPAVPWPSLATTALVSPQKREDTKRNIIWNALIESLWSKKTFLKPFKKQPPLIEKFSLRLWADYFHLPIDARPKVPEQILSEIRKYFFDCDEKEFSHYLVFILNYWNDLNHYKPELINRAVNKALLDAGMGLQYVAVYRWNRFESGSIEPIEVN